MAAINSLNAPTLILLGESHAGKSCSIYVPSHRLSSMSTLIHVNTTESLLEMHRQETQGRLSLDKSHALTQQCDHARPACSLCLKLGADCSYPTGQQRRYNFANGLLRTLLTIVGDQWQGHRGA